MARCHAWAAAPGLGVLLVVCFLVSSPMVAADPAPQVVATLNLGDGRVLHNAKVIADEGDSVVFKADEGLVKVAKSDLPPALSPAFPAPPPPPDTSKMVMVPFNPNPVDPAPEFQPGAKPKPAQPTTPKTVQGSPLVLRGCMIVSFQMKAFQDVQGCAEVVIRNDSDGPVVLFPRNVVCVTSSGTQIAGRYFVSDGFPPIVKRREVVPAQGSIDDTVTFANDALDISKVQWGR
jgi:hypothetical protein